MSTEDIKELRALTGASLLDCKTALEQSHGSLQQARLKLEAQQQQRAQARANRCAPAGRVLALCDADAKFAAIAHVKCESDFAANCTEFRQTLEAIVHCAVQQRVRAVGDLLNATCTAEGQTVAQRLEWLAAQMRERVGLFSYQWLCAEDGALAVCNHRGLIAAAVEVTGAEATERELLARQLVIHPAIAVSQQSLSTEALKGMQRAARAQAREQGVPEWRVDERGERLLQQRLDEALLLRQPWHLQTELSVAQWLNRRQAAVLRFRRCAVVDAKPVWD